MLKVIKSSNVLSYQQFLLRKDHKFARLPGPLPLDVARHAEGPTTATHALVFDLEKTAVKISS